MTATSTTALTIDVLRGALEGTDPEALVALYTDDAEITSIDRENTPSRPRVLTGKDAIRAHFADVCGRDMTHHLEHFVGGDGTAAFGEACRYSDGTKVHCMAVVQLAADGRIARQTDISAWDAA